MQLTAYYAKNFAHGRAVRLGGSIIVRCINNVFFDGDLRKESNVQNLHIASSDKPVTFYRMGAIISIWYQVECPCVQ